MEGNGIGGNARQRMHRESGGDRGDGSGGGDAGLTLLIDKLVHASLIDAVRSVCGSDKKISFRVFPHNHLEKLERLLGEMEPGRLCMW